MWAIPRSSAAPYQWRPLGVRSQGRTGGDVERIALGWAKVAVCSGDPKSTPCHDQMNAPAWGQGQGFRCLTATEPPSLPRPSPRGGGEVRGGLCCAQSQCWREVSGSALRSGRTFGVTDRLNPVGGAGSGGGRGGLQLLCADEAPRPHPLPTRGRGSTGWPLLRAEPMAVGKCRGQACGVAP